MKKHLSILALVMALMLMFTFVGCNGGTEQEPDKTQPVTGGDQPQGETPEPGKGLHIGIVTSSGVDDGSFGQDCYNGILDFCNANPENTYNDVKETDVGKVVQAVADVISDYDVMVMPGFQFSPAGTIAIDNPDKYFILVDSYPKDANDEEVELANMFAMQFKEEESGFFAGVAAALETKTNKVAVVNGMAFPSNVNYQFGFMSGVEYANKHYGTKAECIELPSYAGEDVTGANVGGNYIGAFADQATGKIVGKALLDEGCDIMLVAAGDSGNGVFAAVKEAPAGTYVIGCDVDQYDDGAAGDRNIVLTSALKKMRPQIAQQLALIAEGKFEGKNALLGAAEDATGFVKEAGRHQLQDSTIEKLDEVFELVKDGTIVPAANFNGHTPTDFPGL